MTQPTSQPDDQLVQVELRLATIQHMLEHQAIAIAQLQDEISDARRHNDWYSVQFAEIIRILARDMHELRASLICSVLNDGPISAKILKELLRETDADCRDLEIKAFPPASQNAN